jgi:[ribosomal protein S18]-alanine N-acetyltransferase
MTMKRVEPENKNIPPMLDLSSLPNDLTGAVKYAVASDEDMVKLSEMRSGTDPWKARGETAEMSLQALSKLKPFIQVAKLQSHLIGYVTVERDGPVPGAAYLRNIVVKPELRRKGIGNMVLAHAVSVARDMHRKTLALRVDPANATAVNFYRNAGFTTVATVVSKKSGKLRLLMSREL